MKPPPRVSKEEEAPGVPEEEEPLGIEKEEQCSGPPTSPPSRPMKQLPGMGEEERCIRSYSFPPPAYAREEERCNGDWSFPPPTYAREEEWSRSREKRTSRSDLEPTSS
jgi:hypothetical protein